jgi:hypothetical protein
MSKLSRFVFAVIALVVAGGGAYLATWDPPAPTATVEKVIPNDRFAR